MNLGAETLDLENSVTTLQKKLGFLKEKSSDQIALCFPTMAASMPVVIPSYFP